jgi:hypothetical protein
VEHPVHDINSIGSSAGSYALVSRDPGTDTAVIFVHGFGGDPQTTWLEFPSLIDSCSGAYPWWNTCDVFFYKYPGSRTIPIAVSSHNLLTFLRATFPEPDQALFRFSTTDAKLRALFPSVPLRTDGFRYRKLVLVGHSEGAVVIRRALIEEYKRIRDEGGMPDLRSFRTYEQILAGRDQIQAEFLQKNPLFDAAVVFFAPAHLGATVTGWAGVLLSCVRICSVLAPVFDCLKAYSAAYQDLKGGSPFLNQLRVDTEKFASDFPQPQAFKAKSYFGKKDRIVCIGEYGSDPPATLIESKGHLSVCKPSQTYREPLEYVRYARRRQVSAP